MTNMDYIISQLDERTLASIFVSNGDQPIKKQNHSCVLEMGGFVFKK